jgi:hypothetical protein
MADRWTSRLAGRHVRLSRLGASLLIGAVVGLIVSGLAFASMKSWYGSRGELSTPLLWFAPGMLVCLLGLKSAFAFEWLFKAVNVLYYTSIVFGLISLLGRIKSGR